MSRSCRSLLYAGTITLLAVAVIVGCGSNVPELVLGPSVIGNESPSLTILSPSASLSINQGERLTLRWSDRDPDSAARISFYLQGVTSGTEIELVSNIEENDDVAEDYVSVGTSLVPFGSYYIRGEITDGKNEGVTVFANTEGSTSTRVIVTVGEPGTNPLNVPPRVVVVAPAFNKGVAQDDTLVIQVQPSAAGISEEIPYDEDSECTLYFILDTDEDPENDDPESPDADEIIVLREMTIAAGEYEGQEHPQNIDLAAIPPRAGGLPYYVRATIMDDSNKPVHAYASGTISIVRSASGEVDVAQIGSTLAGARFQGFNPGSLLGTTVTTVTDFDADGIDDFLMIAQYGNPRNLGNIGEAYLVYGLDQERFGGEINVNSVSTTISGVIFEAPPNRLDELHVAELYDPSGLVSASYIPDRSGDGRPELLFGAPLVDGQFQGRDDDPADQGDTQTVSIDISPGQVIRRINDQLDESISDEYTGLIDTYIDRAQPSVAYGTGTSLRMSATGDVDETNPANQFIMVDFTELSSLFTTLTAEDIADLTVTLTLYATELPSVEAFGAHPLITEITDDTTYADFSGGLPGPEVDIDYDSDELDVSTSSGNVVIDMSSVVQDWIDSTRSRTGVILVPTTTVTGTMVASDANVGYPTLAIAYTETLGDAVSVGAYPDNYPNNQTDSADDPNLNLADSTWESLGVVYIVSSENRDNDPPLADATRLESTTVALELAGQESVGASFRPYASVNPYADYKVDAPIRHSAEDPGTGTIRGARLTAGFYEYVNNGNYGQASPRADHWGQHVSWMPDIDNDYGAEYIVSAPRNELYMSELESGTEFSDTTHGNASFYRASIVVFPSEDFTSENGGYDPVDGDGTNFSVPSWGDPDRGDPRTLSNPGESRSGTSSIKGAFSIYAEEITDYLGGAEHAGDVNLDGSPDIVCGAPLNDNPNGLVDTGAVYILYGRTPVGNIDLGKLDDPTTRPPALRIRGETAGDRIGTWQTSGMDVNGDRVDDVFISSPSADYGPVSVSLCGDLDGDGVVDADDLDLTVFTACQAAYGDEVFSDDACKPYDYDNDRDIDDDDRDVFDCLAAGFSDCCPVDNGFVGVIFGKVTLDGDRDISQIGTDDLKGVRFYGASAGDRAGAHISSAGDFNRDGFGDLLIAAPGVTFPDYNNRERMGVAYLIFGGTHLNGNLEFSLNQVGTSALPGIIFWSPFVTGSPNEAPIETVGLLGDINNDGFDDIGLGIPRADYLDSSLPQDPNDPGTDPNIGRRPDDGNIYIVYGNNSGSNQ